MQYASSDTCKHSPRNICVRHSCRLLGCIPKHRLRSGIGSDSCALESHCVSCEAQCASCNPCAHTGFIVGILAFFGHCIRLLLHLTLALGGGKTGKDGSCHGVQDSSCDIVGSSLRHHSGKLCLAELVVGFLNECRRKLALDVILRVNTQ